MLLIIMWGLHALYQYSSFVPQSKDQSQKLTVGVNVSVNGYRSLCVNPVKDWWPVQGIFCLSPYDSLDRFPAPNPELDKQMNVLKEVLKCNLCSYIP